MGNIGPLELGIVLLVVLLIFGPKRLPGLGKQLGTGMREFKDSITGATKYDDEDDGPQALTAAAQAQPPAAAPPAATQPEAESSAESQSAERTTSS